MSGTCQGTINITIPCTPNWIIGAWGACQPDGTQTRTVTDSNNCGVTTGKPATSQTCTYVPLYREAKLTSCTLNKTTVIPGEGFLINIYYETGNVTENYKLVLTGDLSGESSSQSFTGSSSIAVMNTSFGFAIPSTSTGGTKNFTATLVKV